MRVFSRYYFKVGSCSVEEMMENLDSFLFDEKLHYNKLDYYIRILTPEIDKNMRIWIAKDMRIIPRKKDVVVFDVNDLLRDHPEFGCLEKVDPGVVITSLDSFGASKTVKATERDIRNIASQIPIPYFMDDVLFSYSAIDFFGHDRCEVNEPVKMIPWDLLNRKGSHISFSKSVFGSKAIDLCMMVEITAEDGVLCSDRFAQALSQKLDRKYEKETIVFLSQEEREYYAKLSELAKPVVEEICAFFKHSMERYPSDPNAGRFDAKYTKFISSGDIKKIAKEYGFCEYGYCYASIHNVSKRIEGGHYLKLGVDIPPKSNEMRLYAVLNGLGFAHSFILFNARVFDNAVAKEMLRTAFVLLNEMEDSIDALAKIYPPTPDWFHVDATIII